MSLSSTRGQKFRKTTLAARTKSLITPVEIRCQSIAEPPEAHFQPLEKLHG